MKKTALLLFILLGFTLAGCQSNTSDEITCDETSKLVNDECVPIENDQDTSTQENDGSLDNDQPSVSSGTYGYESFIHDGLNREYILYLPDDLPDDSPLVFVLHGFGGNAKSIQFYSGMDDLADIHQFAVVYPQGTIVDNTSHWNAQLAFSDVDDVGFLVALAEHLQNTYQLSAQKTFISGHSNGGFMSYTVACEAPESFLGIASYAGVMSGETWDTCDTTTPMNILHIHGTNDIVVPDDGSMTSWKGWGGAPAVTEMLDYWVTRNALDISSVIDFSDTIELFEYTSNDSPYKVTYYRLIDIGHNWPNDDELHVDEDLLNDTSQLIWHFFETLIESSILD